MEKKETWEVVLTKPAEKIYDKSGKAMRRKFDLCFESLKRNPLYGNNIKSLTGNLKGFSRYRIGDRRIIYRVFEGQMIVEIIAILPGGDAYK